MTRNPNRAEFIKSAGSTNDFLRDGLPGVVFSGRSNVGKSSVINRLTLRNNFARVGNTPGKTAHINYFLIDSACYFIDLPGYGYAKVSKSEKERWGKLMEQFFAEDSLINLGVMIVDSRHKPTGDDVTMANWFKGVGCPLIVVANKSDKLKKSELEPNLRRIADTLELDGAASDGVTYPGGAVTLIPFSAEKGDGRQQLLDAINAALTSGAEL